jgi:hypothetical protein
MAALMWHSQDVPALEELAIIRDLLLAEAKQSVAREVAIRSNQFGLTPAGRQQRRWLIVDDAEPKPTPDIKDKPMRADEET